MLSAPAAEEELGIEVFATSSKGIGGIIRQDYEDFIVDEIPLLTKDTDQAGRSDRGDYTVFSLEKRGLDTLVAIKRIAKELGVGEKRFSFAGMKDSNAVTRQRVSVWNVTPDRLSKISIDRIRLTDISLSDKPIHLGSHYGNRFTIMVRNAELSEQEVKQRIQSTLKSIDSLGGMPNYFGHQRFGLSRPITHIVGLLILKGEFKSAAMSFLSKASPHERDEIRAAREELGANEDFSEAARKFPKQLTYEMSMLRKLSSHPQDFIGAFRALPRRLMRIFVHAAQAWLFNKFISRRLNSKLNLDECVHGDLVELLDDYGLPTLGLLNVNNSNMGQLSDSLKSGKASLVYPVLGFDTKLPSGIMHDIVKEIMTKENLTPRDFWISSMPEVSSPGVLRSIAATPRSFVAEVTSDSGHKCDVKFRFSLARGSYATILLREFMKNEDPLAAGY